MSSQYIKLISELSPGYDPRHIEAFMRLQYGTLDHLSRADFEVEAVICQAAIDHDPAAAERLAKSYEL